MDSTPKTTSSWLFEISRDQSTEFAAPSSVILKTCMKRFHAFGLEKIHFSAQKLEFQLCRYLYCATFSSVSETKVKTNDDSISLNREV